MEWGEFGDDSHIVSLCVVGRSVTGNRGFVEVVLEEEEQEMMGVVSV